MHTMVIFLKNSRVSAWTVRRAQLERLHCIPNLKWILCENEEEFLQALPLADSVVVWYFREAWLKQADHLRYLITPAAGKDFIPFDLPERIIRINGAFHGTIMAETAVGAMLAASRGLFLASEGPRGDLWDRSLFDRNARRFSGSTVSLFGFGAIGREIGQKAHGLGAKIIGITRHPSSTIRPEWFGADDRLVAWVDRLSILPETDHLCFSLPSESSLNNMVDEDFISHLPSHAWVYNLGRGNIMREKDLASAVLKGRISGAFLDVFQQEPFSADSPFTSVSGIFRLPHASAISPDYLDLFFEELVPRMKKEILIMK